MFVKSLTGPANRPNVPPADMTVHCANCERDVPYVIKKPENNVAIKNPKGFNINRYGCPICQSDIYLQPK